MLFSKCTPEQAGVSSKDVLDLIRIFDKYEMHTHSIIMAKGDKIFAEGYYAPFDENFIHRMYSVSKSFVAVAVGLAMTEGLLSLDDPIAKYFPEFLDDAAYDEYYEKCTIRNMLSMQSNIRSNVYWWGKFDSRVKAYYTQKTGQVPGTLFCYDSIGSFLLGCIVEKLTGKTFLEYLKEKVLLKMGFSKDSYTLYEPGGFTVGDSGVMCTARDLAIFSRLIMNEGAYNGKQYIDREFMREAVSVQSDNDVYGELASWKSNGYGYLIWKTHKDGFALNGAFDQLAICDKSKDFIFVINSDNSADGTAEHIIFHELYNHFIDKISDEALPDNPEAQKELYDYLASRKLVHQRGNVTSPLSDKINNKEYVMDDNELNIKSIKLSFDDGGDGVFEFLKDKKSYAIHFSSGKNKFVDFSFGERNSRTTMGKTQKGEYRCAVSAAWKNDSTFAIMLQVIDVYFGSLNIQLGFSDDKVSLVFRKSGQYVFDGINGYAIGKQIQNK